jgi:hypothetical protein
MFYHDNDVFLVVHMAIDGGIVRKWDGVLGRGW